jgi:ribonuclease Z
MAEKINVTFLGTGSAVPTARRNHPSILIQYKSQNLLFDCGEGTQRQFRKAKLNPCKLTKIFISHWHGDHTLGLPGILQTLALNGYNGTLEIHGPRNTKKNIKTIMDFHMKTYLRQSKEEGNNFQIKTFEHTTGKILNTDEYQITCHKLDHDTPALAYTFQIKEKNRLDKQKLQKLNLPNSPLINELANGKTITINGKKINGKTLTYKEPSRKITIVYDTRYNKTIETLAKNSNLLIIESTYAKDDKEIAEKYGHMTSTQAATIAKKSKTKELALIHLSQRYEQIPKIIKQDAEQIFKGKVTVPDDLDKMVL